LTFGILVMASKVKSQRSIKIGFRLELAICCNQGVQFYAKIFKGSAKRGMIEFVSKLPGEPKLCIEFE